MPGRSQFSPPGHAAGRSVARARPPSTAPAGVGADARTLSCAGQRIEERAGRHGRPAGVTASVPRPSSRKAGCGVSTSRSCTTPKEPSCASSLVSFPSAVLPNRHRRGGHCRWVRSCSCRFRANNPAKRHRHSPWQAGRARRRHPALDTQITAAQHDLAARRAEFATAMHTANAAVDAARARGAEADALRKQMDGLVVAAFGGARTARLSANLISTSPQDLLDRMTALDLLGRDTSARMDGALAAEVSPSDQPRTPRRLEMRRSPRRDECRRGCRFRRRPDHLRVSSWNCALRRVGCSAGWASVSSLSGPLSNPYQDMTARPTAPVLSQAGRHVE